MDKRFTSGFSNTTILTTFSPSDVLNFTILFSIFFSPGKFERLCPHQSAAGTRYTVIANNIHMLTTDLRAKMQQEGGARGRPL